MIRSRAGRGRPVPCRTAILLLLVTPGCVGRAIRIDEVPAEWTLGVVLDANATVHRPGRTIKFFVDITNSTPRPLDVSRIEIELEAAPVTEPERVALREEWSYRWKEEDRPQLRLQQGKRVTIPIVPERGVEFALEQLAAGDYRITAVVNGRHRSAPYALRIERPEAATRSATDSRPEPQRS